MVFPLYFYFVLRPREYLIQLERATKGHFIFVVLPSYEDQVYFVSHASSHNEKWSLIVASRERNCSPVYIFPVSSTMQSRLAFAKQNITTLCRSATQ